MTGAIYELSLSKNWESFGSQTPDDCAGVFGDLLENMDKSMIGMILPTITGIPDWGLPLDGQTWSRDIYPDLWDKMPLTLKDDFSFFLPDFTDRFLLAGGNIGEFGGEKEHTLTILEMPAHSHLSHGHLPLEASGELPTPLPDVEFPQETGSTGGGLPHNNMPPYIRVTYFIVSR